jgi:hypothetical protein
MRVTQTIRAFDLFTIYHLRFTNSVGTAQDESDTNAYPLPFTIYHLRFTAFDLFTIYHLRFTNSVGIAKRQGEIRTAAE